VNPARSSSPPRASGRSSNPRSPEPTSSASTPSEKEQIEAIVDAVADGRADEIRDADVYDGANRYRARFLRAKLFDEDGDLGGVETGE